MPDEGMKSGRGRGAAVLLLALAAGIAAGSCAFLLSARTIPPETETQVLKLRDLDGDGETETLRLENGRFFASRGETELFSSPPEWEVERAESSDVDGDGKEEVLLLVLKEGSYGDSMPFWEEKNTEGISQHIFIYRVLPERLKPMWMSSDIGMKVTDWEMTEDPGVRLHAEDGSITVWAWEGFGLKLLRDETTGRVQETREEKPHRAVDYVVPSTIPAEEKKKAPLR